MRAGGADRRFVPLRLRSGVQNGLVLAAIQTSNSAAPSSDLYRINLATGVATPIGTPGGTAQIGPVGTQQIRSLAIDLR